MNRVRSCVLVLVAGIILAGCALNRAGVTALNENQQAYSIKLDAMLIKGRPSLQQGLEAQLATNAKRRMKLNEWQHDLERAEILLQVDANVTGNKRLLSLQLAQLNLERIETLAGRDETSAEQVTAILGLYDRIQDAVAELQKNNKIITEYLGSGDRQFVLRSLDVDGIVAAVAGIQGAREQLGHIELRTDEERMQDREQIQKNVQRAREVLLRVFEANN